MQILYIDMDGVIFDFASAIDNLDEETKSKYENRLDEVPGIFNDLKPINDSISSIELLSKYFDIYVII